MVRGKKKRDDKMKGAGLDGIPDFLDRGETIVA